MKKKEIDSSKIKILICCHKPCELPKDDIFLPIQVGAAISDIDLGMQRDDQVNGEPCDNISAKNKSYCELTAMYWAWKNIKKIYPDLEYIGLNHYRRYFDFEHVISFKDLHVRRETEIPLYVLDKKRMQAILKKNKAIIGRKKIYPYPLYLDYANCHISDDLRVLEQIIQEKASLYLPMFKNLLWRTNALAPCNMTVMEWKDFDLYCTWLFKILASAEERINIENYSDVQRRIFGYMAERLFNVWLLANNIKTKEVPIAQFADGQEDVSLPYYLFRCLRYSLSNMLLRSWRKR